MARKVIFDDDAPEITAEMFAKMRPMKEVAPDLVAAHKALRGRPKLENPKQVVSIRMSASAVKRWSAMGRAERAKLITALEKKIEKRA
jgi:uncharacterized protein (DUF4415 family)